MRIIKSLRIKRFRASGGENPKSRKALPVDSVIKLSRLASLVDFREPAARDFEIAEWRLARFFFECV